MERTYASEEVLRTESLSQCWHRMQQVVPLLTSGYRMHLEKMQQDSSGVATGPERADAEAVRSLLYSKTGKPTVSDYFRSILRGNDAMKQCETCFQKKTKLRCG